MTLQYAREIILILIAQAIEEKERKITELATENLMLKARLEDVENELAKLHKESNGQHQETPEQ